MAGSGLGPVDTRPAQAHNRGGRASEKPELLVDAQLSVKGLDMLVRAVGARYRLSPKSRNDLADNLAATLNSLGDQLLPPEG